MVIDKKPVSKVKISELPPDMMIHTMEESKNFMNKPTIIAGVVIVVLGVLSGFLLTRGGGGVGLVSDRTGTTEEKKTVGSSDTKTFPDTAEGTLEAGGIDGEGTHHLVRPGGESQTVYLTSSVLDLKEFEGKKVRIWGATFAAQKAGWLMDVGKVEVIQ
ncbi:hypothetical protein HYW55_03705 [Candidatus Gottesmanbacteria bacterium]|nr:hypothetical protein [Candidatus Gottesmanbacteria bacterium]